MSLKHSRRSNATSQQSHASNSDPEESQVIQFKRQRLSTESVDDQDMDEELEYEQEEMEESSDVGTIENVELVNFMCHTYTSVDLCPKINFIVGHNGSGKSAILTALTVCLGGKASFTNRATSIKGLIKEGKDLASVSVKIRNKGYYNINSSQDSYRHEMYGDTITITRDFGRDKAASYKIKSKNGKFVASTTEELHNICDHFQIEVDNPMAILTQDTARSFLANSTPKDKYKFFVKGTQIERLTEDFNKLEENLDGMEDNLERKMEILPEIELEVKDLEKKWAV